MYNNLVIPYDLWLKDPLAPLRMIPNEGKDLISNAVETLRGCYDLTGNYDEDEIKLIYLYYISSFVERFRCVTIEPLDDVYSPLINYFDSTLSSNIKVDLFLALNQIFNSGKWIGQTIFISDYWQRSSIFESLSKIEIPLQNLLKQHDTIYIENGCIHRFNFVSYNTKVNNCIMKTNSAMFYLDFEKEDLYYRNDEFDHTYISYFTLGNCVMKPACYYYECDDSNFYGMIKRHYNNAQIIDVS